MSDCRLYSITGVCKELHLMHCLAGCRCMMSERLRTHKWHAHTAQQAGFLRVILTVLTTSLWQATALTCDRAVLNACTRCSRAQPEQSSHSSLEQLLSTKRVRAMHPFTFSLTKSGQVSRVSSTSAWSHQSDAGAAKLLNVGSLRHVSVSRNQDMFLPVLAREVLS